MREDGAVGVRVVRLVALQLQVIILAEQVLEPQHGFLRLGQLPLHDQLRDLPAQAGGADYQVLVIALQQLLVDARTAVEAFRPREGDHLDQVLVAILVLRQHDEVPAAAVVPRGQLAMPPVAGAIALAPQDGFEYRRLRLGHAAAQLLYAPQLLVRGVLFLQQRLQLLLRLLDLAQRLAVLLIHLVEKLLDAEHHAVVGHGDGAHTVFISLVYQSVDRCLPIQQGILRVNV